MSAKRYKDGIRCGLCESHNTGVTQTIHVDHGIKRIRKCKDCGHCFTTYEMNIHRLSTEPKFDFLFQKVTQ